MSTPSQIVAGQGVVLLRPGVGDEIIELPDGASLADVLRKADVDVGSQDVFVDGRPLAEEVILRPGSVVSIVPRVRNASEHPAWWNTVGMFGDDAGFEAFTEDVQARRESEPDPT